MIPYLRKLSSLFSEKRILSPVWLSGAESQLKMTANSTYWEANCVKDGLGEGGNEKGRAVLGWVDPECLSSVTIVKLGD